jgi:hypothetical protein
MKLGTGLTSLLPLLLGAGVGVLIYKMHADKQVASVQQAAKAAAVQDTMRGALSNSLYLSYNTVPYFLDKLPTTTEWNPENLQFSGSISDAGNGYTYVIPKSAM